MLAVLGASNFFRCLGFRERISSSDAPAILSLLAAVVMFSTEMQVAAVISAIKGY